MFVMPNYSEEGGGAKNMLSRGAQYIHINLPVPVVTSLADTCYLFMETVAAATYTSHDLDDSSRSRSRDLG